jgi:hypothetical protein
VTGHWRILHGDELYNLCGRDEKWWKIVGGKPKGKTRVGRRPESNATHFFSYSQLILLKLQTFHTAI